MQIIINNLQEKVEISTELECKLMQYVARGFMHGGVEDGEVCITFVDDEYIRELNERFRNVAASTDVLSFPMNEEGLMGDVVISLETAARQAKEYGHSFEREVVFLAVHGVLHLMGYDHETQEDEEKMMQMADGILEGMER
jgi:probable rRNA maturation factor